MPPFFYFTETGYNILVPHEHVDKAFKLLDTIIPYTRNTAKARQWTFKDECTYRLAASRLVGRGFHVEMV